MEYIQINGCGCTPAEVHIPAKSIRVWWASWEWTTISPDLDSQWLSLFILTQIKYHYRTCPYTKMMNCCTNLSTCWEGFTLLKRTCLKKLLRLRCVVLPVDDLCVVIVVPVTDYSWIKKCIRQNFWFASCSSSSCSNQC